MSIALDRALIAEMRQRACRAGLARATPAKAVSLAVPDLATCLYDPSTERFRLLYIDGTLLDIRREELADADGRVVVACRVDASGRGVDVAFEDGAMTSFSAEFPHYLRDAAYRARVDARRGGGRDDLGQRVGHRVREIRHARGLSITDLSRRTGIAAPNLHRLESGRHVPSTATLVRVAASLGVSVARLVRHGPAHQV